MIKFYQPDTGYAPVRDFLDSLSGKEAKKVLWVLQLIQEMEVVPTCYFVKLVGTNDVWECRISFGSNIYRILAFWHSGELVLTHGFAKKTQKTPSQEIQRVEAIKKDYIARYGGVHEK